MKFRYWDRTGNRTTQRYECGGRKGCSKKSDILGYDTVIDTEKMKIKNNKTITTKIEKCQDYGKVIDEDTVLATGTTEITTNKTVQN